MNSTKDDSFKKGGWAKCTPNFPRSLEWKFLHQNERPLMVLKSAAVCSLESEIGIRLLRFERRLYCKKHLFKFRVCRGLGLCAQFAFDIVRKVVVYLSMIIIQLFTPARTIEAPWSKWLDGKHFSDGDSFVPRFSSLLGGKTACSGVFFAVST
jgi:hypothetical protein